MQTKKHKYIVTLLDKEKEKDYLKIGAFYAENHYKAIELAQKKYITLFKKIKLKSWSLEAEIQEN
jgi:hypothetical protein